MPSSPPLRIALATSTFLPALGGAEVGLHNIASRLAARGHHPTVIVPRTHADQLARLGWVLPYPVISFPPKVWGLLDRLPAVGLPVLSAVYSLLQARHRFDFWHGTMGWPIGVSLVRWATARGIPHLVRCAGEDIQRLDDIGYGARRNPKVDAAIRTWLPRADTLVAITESVAAEYGALGVEPSRIARIPNGVDCARFASVGDRAATRAALGAGPDDFLFLAVGRNHPKKAFADLIRAAGLLRQATQRPFRVALVGAGVGALAPLAAEHGIADLVTLREATGGPTPGGDLLKAPSDDLVAVYQAADAFIFPSLIETFGIVLVEAMAAGLPVVTTRAPGCRDVVREGVDGTLVPPADPAALAQAMDGLLTSPDACRHWAERSLARAREFDWDGVVDRYEAIYAGAHPADKR